MSNEEVNLISLSPSDGWAIPIEKYSSVLLEGLWGLLQWYDSHLKPVLLFLLLWLCRRMAYTQLYCSLLLKNKTKKPKQKGKRLFGVSFLVVILRSFKQNSGAPVWPPDAQD